MFQSNPLNCQSQTNPPNLQVNSIYHFYSQEGFSALKLLLSRFTPTLCGCHMELPPALKKKSKSLTNIRSTDDKCLLYCLIAGTTPTLDRWVRYKAEKYQQYVKDWNMDGVTFPVTIIPVLQEYEQLFLVFLDFL